MNFDYELLDWIQDETDSRKAASQGTLVPVHVLLVRMSLRSKANSLDLTQSVELSLKTYDRATVFRTLKQLESRGLIQIVSDGSPDQSLKQSQGSFTSKLSSKRGEAPLPEIKSPEAVILTDLGRLTLKRLEQVNSVGEFLDVEEVIRENSEEE